MPPYSAGGTAMNGAATRAILTDKPHGVKEGVREVFPLAIVHTHVFLLASGCGFYCRRFTGKGGEEPSW